MAITPPVESPLPDGFPAWITPSLPKAGRDPLALQTITEDRITPLLLPGVLALSQRARYFSYYPFLLHEYRRAEGRASNAGLDVFIKRRDFEFAVAARPCPNCPTGYFKCAQRSGWRHRQSQAPRPEDDRRLLPLSRWVLGLTRNQE